MPWTGRPSKGEFLDLLRNFATSMRYGPLEIEQHHVGRRALGEAALRQAEDVGRPAGQAAQQVASSVIAPL